MGEQSSKEIEKRAKVGGSRKILYYIFLVLGIFILAGTIISLISGDYSQVGIGFIGATIFLLLAKKIKKNETKN